MNDHLQKLREREIETKKQKQKNIRMGRLLLAATLLGLSIFSILTITSTIEPKNSAQAKEHVADATAGDTEDVDKDSWELVLVNTRNMIPEDFTVDLKPFESTRVDYRIAGHLQEMIDAAKKDGISISVCSGFRTVSEQDALYNAKCEKYEAGGYSEEASRILAGQYIQPGGASEHHTGLAVDLLTDETSELTESFAETPAYTWLKDNAAKYGFIERYPSDKSEITGISWEPWHYRYVGKSNAETITEDGLCLEEYLLREDG
ncbi:MAG: M15 family metallopeptidase [Oscillospiraceae bacterium]|nr:M15 family metallopeptidase [Oscillospiraceae bacterium]